MGWVVGATTRLVLALFLRFFVVVCCRRWHRQITRDRYRYRRRFRSRCSARRGKARPGVFRETARRISVVGLNSELSFCLFVLFCFV